MCVSSGANEIKYYSRINPALLMKNWVVFSRLIIATHKNLPRIGDNLKREQMVSNAVTTELSDFVAVVVRSSKASGP